MFVLLSFTGMMIFTKSTPWLSNSPKGQASTNLPLGYLCLIGNPSELKSTYCESIQQMN